MLKALFCNNANITTKGLNMDDDLFECLPEGTRIIISGKSVTFENMTPELLDVAKALNPEDKDIQVRMEACKNSKAGNPI